MEVFTFTPTNKRASDLAERVKGVACRSIVEIPKCQFYLIGCKPQQFDKLAETLHPHLNGSEVIISKMAGKNVEVIGKKLKSKSKK